MADKKFELGDYIEVKDRLAIFYELYPQGRLQTASVELTSEPDGVPRVIVKAFAFRTPEDTLPGTGTSWLELPGRTPYTKGSEVENAETSAWGRAIASLGILIDKSIASAQEVQNKQDDGRPVAKPQPAATNGGLIGQLVAQGTQDFALRQTPDGWVLPFRVKEGSKSQIVIAHDQMAQALDFVRDEALNARVTVFGTYTDESFEKAGRTTNYQVLHLTRIVGPDFTIPMTTAAILDREPQEAESVPAFTADELVDVK